MADNYDNMLSMLNDDDDDIESMDEITVENGPRKPWERDYTPEQLAERERKRAAGEYLPGTKKRKTTYRRSRITEKDLVLMAFLARFTYSTSTQLALLGTTSWRAVHNRLLGLEEMKMVRRAQVPGARVLWMLTSSGATCVEQSGFVDGDAIQLLRPDDLSIASLGHTLAINQTVLWMMRGWPFDDVVRKLGGPYSLEAFVSEYQIRSAFQAQWLTASVAERELRGREGLGHSNRERRLAQLESGSLTPANFIGDDASLWTLAYPKAEGEQSNAKHTPDLVLNLEATRTSDRPVSVALEVELSKKTYSALIATLRIYKKDTSTYRGVVWLVHSEAVAKQLRKGITALGLDKRMFIARFPDHDGTPFDGKPWSL